MSGKLVRPETRNDSALRRKILTSPESFGTALFMLLLDYYGPETDEEGGIENPEVHQWLLLKWAPETIARQIFDDFGVEIPPVNFHKLMAAITIVSTDFFFRDPYRFIVLTNALCGDSFDPMTFDVADAAEMVWAISEALLLAHPENENPFCPEIRMYIAKQLKEEGFASAPDVLRLAIGEDFSGAVMNDFTDDPAMFEAIWTTQNDKTEGITRMLKENLAELQDQLQSLPLRRGNAEEVFKSLHED